jgi:hypothetical protein
MARFCLLFLAVFALGAVSIAIFNSCKSDQSFTPKGDAFGEQESEHRYAASQARHWRQILIKR